MTDVIWAALVGVVFGGAFPWPVKALWRLLHGDAERERGELDRLAARNGDLEDLIDLLRKALDKHLIRESAIAAAAELMVNMMDQALDHVAEPPLALLRTRDRAVELLKAARKQIEKINEGSRRSRASTGGNQGEA